ncbi:hypothetical protein UlMin_040684 [Ulmus minor]
MVNSGGISDDGSGSFGSVAPFLRKCYEMVDDEATNSIISWSDANDSFVIWDMTQFSVGLLPKYFKHSNFSSFMRQLNIYGFRKIDTDHWIFANEGFIRGQKHLLKNISRRKHVQGPDQRKASQQKEQLDVPCEKIEDRLWKEVENLKTDKNVLMQELVNLRQHQETAENKLILLRDRLQGMEKNQQQMLSFLVMAIQSPVFVKLLQPKENNWRMAEAGNMLGRGMGKEKRLASDNMIVRYHPPLVENSHTVFTSASSPEKLPELDSCSDGMGEFFMNSDFMKILMDEKLSSLENHAPFVFPDFTDDGGWEQHLLASPSIENTEDGKVDGKDSTESDMEAENSQSFDSLVEQMEKSQNFEMESTVNGLQKSQNLELLTEQMGLLASKPI